MKIFDIIKLEQSNQGMIYFFLDEDNSFVAYGLSAYILSKAYSSSIILELKDMGKYKDILMTKIPAELILEHFTGNNTWVGNDYIQVDLTASLGSAISLWKSDFLIDRQRKVYNVF